VASGIRGGDTTLQVRRLGGDASRGELHGFTTNRGANGWFVVRNPNPWTRRLSVPFGQVYGPSSGHQPPWCGAALLYPRREQLDLADEDGAMRLRLGPFETLLVAVGPRQSIATLVEGWPRHVLDFTLLDTLAGGMLRGVIRYLGATPGEVVVLCSNLVLEGTLPAPALRFEERVLPLVRAPAGGRTFTSVFPAAPAHRYELELTDIANNPFPGAGYHRASVWVREPLGDGQATPVGKSSLLPPLPARPDRGDGVPLLEVGRRKTVQPSRWTSPHQVVARDAQVRLEIFGCEGDDAERWLMIGTTPIARLPANEHHPSDSWETVELRVPAAALVQIELLRSGGRSVSLHVENRSQDRFKFRNVELALDFGPDGWLLSDPDSTVHSSGDWEHAEGERFEAGRSRPIVVGFR
jgi:hypothetical protein